MSSSRLSNISGSNNTDIKIADLQCVRINSIDTNSVKKLVKKIKVRLLSHFVFASLAFVFASYVLYDTINTSTDKFNNEIIAFLFIDLMFLGVLYYIFKQILSIMNCRYKKAQYGIVKIKYSLKDFAKSSSSKKYYISALFPASDMYIRGVICTYDIYKTLEEGSPVLVISFDNKKAFAVPSNVENN